MKGLISANQNNVGNISTSSEVDGNVEGRSLRMAKKEKDVTT